MKKSKPLQRTCILPSEGWHYDIWQCWWDWILACTDHCQQTASAIQQQILRMQLPLLLKLQIWTMQKEHWSPQLFAGGDLLSVIPLFLFRSFQNQMRGIPVHRAGLGSKACQYLLFMSQIFSILTLFDSCLHIFCSFLFLFFLLWY